MNFGQPKLTIAECEEKQRNEFDALQAIYWDSKIVDLRTRQAWKVVYKHSEVNLAVNLNMEDIFRFSSLLRYKYHLHLLKVNQMLRCMLG